MTERLGSFGHPLFYDTMIYIHVPYCRSFCTYCDFYSEIPDGGVAAGGMTAYVDALCAEICAKAGEIPWEHDTLYIGGGTPSVLPVGDIRRIVAALKAARKLSGDAAGQKAGLHYPEKGRTEMSDSCASEDDVPQWEEFTVEVNPDDVVRRGGAYVRALKEIGVNRISMGVQSLDDGVLRWMNRRHSAAQARRAYGIIRDAGIDNISVDLIFGFGKTYGSATEIPGKNMEEELMDVFGRTVDGILDIGGDGMPPRHISAYQLSVEPGSTLAEMVAAGQYVPASDELCARQYEMLCGRLAEAGYRHYEISNFAQPGYESRHNSAYWKHIPYIGFGPAAHSFFIKDAPSVESASFPDLKTENLPASKIENGKIYLRRWNRPDIGAYLNAASAGDWSSVSDGEVLTPEQILQERIMLSLRTAAGIDLRELTACPPSGDHVWNGDSNISDRKDLESRIGVMLQNGSLEIQGSRVRIPERRFFVSDDIISDLI